MGCSTSSRAWPSGSARSITAAELRLVATGAAVYCRHAPTRRARARQPGLAVRLLPRHARFPAQDPPLQEETVEGKGSSKILLLDLSGVLSEDLPSFSIGSAPPRVALLAQVPQG